MHASEPFRTLAMEYTKGRDKVLDDYLKVTVNYMALREHFPCYNNLYSNVRIRSLADVP